MLIFESACFEICMFRILLLFDCFSQILFSSQDELIKVIRQRGRQDKNMSDDEDLGLPRSPASNSPTTADDMFPKVSTVIT